MHNSYCYSTAHTINGVRVLQHSAKRCWKNKMCLRGVVIIKFIQHPLLDGSYSVADWTAHVKAFGSIQVCSMPLSLLYAPPPPPPPPRFSAHYRCPSLLASQRSLASLITNLETSHLLYLFSRQDPPHSCLYPKGSIKRFIKHV